ncbi:oligosaccharide flippase family protein [Sphingobium tyrosinilyticum]|uniref:Oligosaccharide flippase family protein n=1 Tax=Sphingobium tyrosinilyticum TaxID=2715436 RepID=A0ABV9EYD0_9SPHN
MTITNKQAPRLGWNFAAGVASTAWTAIVTICTVPLYLHYLGMEAYGLIGFYTALQAMFAVLDLGLSQSINREVARAHSEDERARARDLLHTLAFGYWAVAFAIAIGMWAAAPLISKHWLSASTDTGTLSNVIALMGFTVACRFPLSLYLGALMGARRMGLASAIEIIMVAVANLGVVGILAKVSPTLEGFFLWQALVAMINILLVKAIAWRVLEGGGTRRPRFDMTGVHRIWRFSAGLAVTAILGAMFVQSDKVVLSKIVPLSDLGRYTLASIVARSLYVLTAPAFSAAYPQMVSMHAGGRIEEIAQLYRLGTRLLMAVLFPAAIFLAVFSTMIFTLWTGNPELAKGLYAIVGLLLLGTALNSAMHFPYALQLAFGQSSLPMIINIILMAVFAPLLILLSLRLGILGAAAAWAILNTLYLFLGTWLTHRRLLPGIGMRWLGSDVGFPLFASLVIVGGGGLGLQSVGLPAPAAAAIGLLLAGLTFLTIFLSTSGMAEFARSMFVLRAPPLSAKA